MKLNIKNKILVALAISIAIFMILGCVKDLGNYDYKDQLNTAVVSNLDTIYSVQKNETLTITPKISFTEDPVGNMEDYKLEWVSIGRKGFLPSPEVFSEGPTLRYTIGNEPLGARLFALRVTDKKTGVFKDFPFTILVSSPFYEGWMVLSEIPGNNSRLDMMSFDPLTKKYTFLNDALKAANSALHLSGKPSFIKFFNLSGSAVPISNGSLDAILIGTSTLATYIGADTLDLGSRFDLQYHYADGINHAIGPDAKMGDPNNTSLWIYANNNVSNFEGSQYNGKYDILNKRLVNGTVVKFKPAPFVSHGNDKDLILFDEDASEFVWYTGFYNPCIKLENGTVFNNKVDKDLLFMRRVTYDGGNTFAILKDKGKSNIHLARFTPREQISMKELTGTLMDKADMFEISNEHGAIFYTVGSKLYQYDIGLSQNKLMVDYGNRKISYIKFNEFQDIFMTAEYRELTRKLIVCTYDENNLQSSGEMIFYTVPPAGGQITKDFAYTGFGKIKDFTYRVR